MLASITAPVAGAAAVEEELPAEAAEVGAGVVAAPCGGHPGRCCRIFVAVQEKGSF